MSDLPNRASWKKRILLVLGGLAAFLLLSVLAVRITVMEMFRGIETSHATGLSALASWDVGSMWSGGLGAAFQRSVANGESWIARSADLRMHTSSFDNAVTMLHQIESVHRGYLEDLRTESRSGFGRALAAIVSVPSSDFDATLADLKTLGRVEAVSEAGEDSAVKLASTARHLAATHTNLSRLQKLQRERKGELRDAVALEKDIAQASEAVTEAERQDEALHSTVAQAHIRVTLMEDYRAPFESNLPGTTLYLRNSLFEGLGGTLTSISVVVGVLLQVGLPLLCWTAILFFPGRMVWRRFHRIIAEPIAAK